MRKKTKQKNYQYNPNDWDEKSTVRVVPKKVPKGYISTSIRLPVSMIFKMRKIADRKGGIGYQTLMKLWIAERIEKESV